MPGTFPKKVVLLVREGGQQNGPDHICRLQQQVNAHRHQLQAPIGHAIFQAKQNAHGGHVSSTDQQILGKTKDEQIVGLKMLKLPIFLVSSMSIPWITAYLFVCFSAR